MNRAFDTRGGGPLDGKNSLHEMHEKSLVLRKMGFLEARYSLTIRLVAQTPIFD
jgi:hypothetical protein